MPIICVLAPAFRLHVARLSDPDVPTAGPVLVADKPERGRVIECSAAASALGVRPGMTLVQAQAAARDARVVIDDPRHDAGIWQAMLEALDAASPLIDDAGLGCAYLEMHGIEGGTAGWLAAVRGALSGFDLPLRLGLAANPFVARAAALVGDGTSLDDGMAADFLAPLPLETLELDTATIERLAILGIRTLGELAALPHGPFVRRFGPEGAVWHDRARGIDPRPLRPRARAMRIDRTLYGEGSASSEDQVLFALRTLVGRVVDDLEVAGKRCGALVLGLECEDGDVHEITTRVAQPTAQPTTLFELLRARLEGVVLRSAVVGLRLAAGHLENGGVQIALFAAGDPDPDALGIAIARLDAALGEDHALRARVVEGPRIESRYALEPFTLDTPANTAWSAGDASVSALPGTAAVQLRLIDSTPVDVLLRAGMPRFIGSPPQAIIDVAGPWRVDESWWTPATGGGTPLMRDEYDVLLEDGALVRLVREGERWSVRGMYD
ncbi:MAG: DNA polymerase Y family protein [Candidatus Velthaea sp.]|jgi:protein ImuB